jgi:hypothetical protein
VYVIVEAFLLETLVVIAELVLVKASARMTGVPFPQVIRVSLQQRWINWTTVLTAGRPSGRFLIGQNLLITWRKAGLFWPVLSARIISMNMLHIRLFRCSIPARVAWHQLVARINIEKDVGVF